MADDRRTRLLQSDLRWLISPDLLADPYPAYEELRGPPVRMRSGTILVTGYADGATVLRDGAFIRETMPKLPSRTMRIAGDMLIMLNPPDHARLRRAANRLLPAEALECAERRAHAITDGALSAGRATGGVEVVGELAKPVAISVIADLLGVPDADRGKVQDWSARWNQSIDSPVPLRATRARDVPAVMRHQQVGVRTLGALSRSVRYAERVLGREDHGESAVIVRTLRALVEDGTLTASEATSIWLQVLIAGFDTVQTMIASAVWLLATHPDQYDRLTSDPALLPGAIEEVLRFESPTRLFGRVVGERCELSGVELEPGDDVVVIFGAANRDPDTFPEPHRFDIARPRTPKHLAFGHGIHFCLGAQLARAEATGTLRALIDFLGTTPPTIDDVEWRRSYFFRGLDRLRLRF